MRFVVVFCAVVIGGVLLFSGAIGTATAETTAPTCSDIGFDQTDGVYEVENVSQLQCIGNGSSGVGLDDEYVLVNDINASNTSEWNDGKGFEPVGNESEPFTGEFDGNNYTIDGLTIDRPDESYVGVFGYLTAHADDVALTNASVDGDARVGALAGHFRGTETDMSVSGASVTGTIDGSSDVGGLVGRMEKTDGVAGAASVVERSSANVTVDGTTAVGGLVGNLSTAQTAVDYVSTSGSVTGERDVGGVVGRVPSVGLHDLTSNASVDGTERIGGLIGTYDVDGGAVGLWSSNASGDVAGNESVGGLIGNAEVNLDPDYPYDGSDSGILDVEATGNVSGHRHVGGLIGSNDIGVWDSSATGTVVGLERVGGLVGTNGDYGKLANVTGTGDVHGIEATGGLVGHFHGNTQDDPSYATDATDPSESDEPFDRVDTGEPLYVADATATGDVLLHSDADYGEKMGGLIGRQVGGSVWNAETTGDVAHGNEVGGLVGRAEGGLVARSLATGDVQGVRSSAGYLKFRSSGGLVANTTGNVSKSRSTGDVVAGSIVGGLTGQTAGVVADSTASGNVTGEILVGGGSGVFGTVEDSFATGRVFPEDDEDDFGGLAGGNWTFDLDLEESEIRDSYWDVDATNRTTGVGAGSEDGATGLTTTEMTGSAAEGNMTGLDFGSTWRTTNRYPQLSWQPDFDVSITDTNEPVTGGENLTVTAEVTNTGDRTDEQTVWLTDTGFENQERDSVDVLLEPGESTTVTLEWATDDRENDTGTVTVSSPHATATETVTVEAQDFGPAGMIGSGTSDEPYVITNSTQLQAMEQDLGAYYELGNDINASNTTEWNDGEGFGPVGNESEPFTGVLDGRGHTIDGLTINRSDEDNVGLIGYTDSTSPTPEISDVTMTNATVVGDDYVGILAGYPYFGPDISDVHVQGTVTGTDYVGGAVGQMYLGDLTGVSANTTVTGRNDVGGLGGFVRTDSQDVSVESTVDGEDRVGGAFGTQQYDTSNVSVTTDVTGSSDVGGLAGTTTEKFEELRESSASGTVTGTTNVGGLVGETTVVDVVDSSASATVDGSQNVGGLVGNVSDADRDPVLRATVRNSNASGDVYGEQYVGGLVGVINGGEYSGGEWDHGLVTDSSATGDVIVDNENYGLYDHVGGLVGIMRDSPDGDDSPRIQDSWASGTIVRVGDNRPTYVGGLVGTVDAGTVARSSATGDLEGEAWTGGLVGNNSGTIVESRASGYIDGSDTTAGLASKSQGTIARSSSIATVDGNHYNTGGLLAYNNGGEVNDSWAAGPVSANADRIGGLLGTDEGTVTDSYWDVDATTRTTGVGSGSADGTTGLSTAEMTGPAAEGNMTGIDFPGTWETTNRYPHLEWQPAFDVAIEDADASVTAGENITVTAEVTNTGEMADGQELWLTDTGFDDAEQDSTTVALEPGESETVTLEWETDAGDVGDGDVTVSSANATATESVEITEPTIDADESTVTATSPHVANGSDAATVTATVVDENGDPVTGLSSSDLDLAIGGDATVDSGPTETESGVYEFTVTDETVESVSASVTADGITLADEPTIEFVEPPTADFDVEITDTSAPVTAGDELTVTANVTNTGDATGTQTLSLADTGFGDTEQDAVDLTLAAGESNDSVTLNWSTDAGDVGDGDVTVASDDATGTASVTVELYAGGDGSESNPYEIANWYHLDNARDNLGSEFVLTADLDSNTAGYDDVASDTADGDSGFDPIGEDGDAFTGTLDGGEYGLSGLTINRTEANDVGLFGTLEGSVTNLTVDGAVTGSSAVGAVVGTNNGIVAKINASADVTGDDVVGGLVGRNDEIVRNASARGDVTGDSRVGGLIGHNTDTDGDGATIVRDSFAVGEVTTDGDGGGLVGENEESVTDAYWDTEASGLSEAVGSGDGEVDARGLTTEEMQGLNGWFFMDDVVVEKSEYNLGGYLHLVEPWEPTEGYPTLVTDSDGGKYTYEVAAELLEGSGDENDPYVVTTVGELQAVMHNVDRHYVLGNDIDANGTEHWNDGDGFEPISNNWEGGHAPFSGSFDGQGHTVSNLTITPSSPGGNSIDTREDKKAWGLFDTINPQGEARNVALEDVHLEYQTSTSESAGGVVGSNGGTVENVSVSGYVAGGSITGGIVGTNDPEDPNEEGATIRNATSTATVTSVSREDQDVGGVAGVNRDGIERSVASGEVQSNETSENGRVYVGGFVGENDEGTVTDSRMVGTVESNGLKEVDELKLGGFVGDNGGDSDVGTITGSYATGNVQSDGRYEEGDLNIGGFAGDNGDTIRESYALGDVQSDELIGGAGGDLRANVGGFVGDASGGTVADSYAVGEVHSGERNDAEELTVGGFAGNVIGTIERSYATGPVTVDGNEDTYVGGFVGLNGEDDVEGTVEDSFWDVDETGQDASDGDATGLTTDEMQRLAPYTNMDGFSFGSAETWLTVDGYPALAWEDATELTLDSIDADDAAATAGESATVTITAEADDGGPAEQVDIDVTDDGGIDFDSTTETTDENGEATFEFSENETGEYDVDFDWTEDSSVQTTSTVTVESASEAEFRRTNLSLSPRAVAPGESVEVSVDVENVGDASGVYGLAVTVDGERTVVEVGGSLAPGEQIRDAVNLTFDEPGEFGIGVVGLQDDPQTQTVTVENESTDLSITEFDLSETTLAINESLTATATVTNDGDAAGNITVPLLVDNETVAEETVEVPANDTEQVTLDHEFDAAGNYSVAVGDRDPTDVTVTDRADEEPAVDDYADDETGRVDTAGLREAIADWRTDDIDTDLLRDVIDAWRSGERIV